jgi:hypothetical protein
MLGGTISDLEAGDVFKPVEYVLTAFMCSEYAHGVETGHEWFHSAHGGRQMRPPTMIHVDKMRILEANCLKERRVSAGGRITTDAAGPAQRCLRRRAPDRQRQDHQQVRQARPAVHRLLP